MNAGEMRDKIIILKRRESTGPVKPLDDGAFEDYCALWAKVEYLRGSEFWSAKAVNAETTVRFIIRYRTDIKPDMRVNFDGKIYSITAVMPLDNTRRWTTIHASEVAYSE
ncbi:phage head closure protein [Acinetobacter sp.]|uniref:phage head closure protein n=1 Tax=Acinetobacter sp. TaxID=472 RepID=UPI003D0086AB